MNWQPPLAAELMDVVNATWPAARQFRCGPFLLRDGQQAGKRASAATLETDLFTNNDIISAQAEMLALNQPSLFMIRNNEPALDTALEHLGYEAFDFVTLFAAPSALLAAKDTAELHAIASPEPLAAMAEIWAAGDIGPMRINAMLRAADPKTFYLGRTNDTPAGAAFVAVHNRIAMIHALEVAAPFRRCGLGQQIMAAAAAWALSNASPIFALVVLSSNKAACGLYRNLGMVEAGHYHYRIKR